ncbi:MAG: hypothetical protein OEM51_09930 [Gammaproteobacteria bacterium]|nr:hypothetical protein [Gammaproteobacteria bacterium]
MSAARRIRERFFVHAPALLENIERPVMYFPSAETTFSCPLGSGGTPMSCQFVIVKRIITFTRLPFGNRQLLRPGEEDQVAAVRNGKCRSFT